MTCWRQLPNLLLLCQQESPWYLPVPSGFPFQFFDQKVRLSLPYSATHTFHGCPHPGQGRRGQREKSDMDSSCPLGTEAVWFNFQLERKGPLSVFWVTFIVPLLWLGNHFPSLSLNRGPFPRAHSVCVTRLGSGLPWVLARWFYKEKNGSHHHFIGLEILVPQSACYLLLTLQGPQVAVACILSGLYRCVQEKRPVEYTCYSLLPTGASASGI